MSGKPEICEKLCILGMQNLCDVLEPDGLTGPLEYAVARYQARYAEICIHFSCPGLGLPAAREVYVQGKAQGLVGMQPFGTSEKPEGRFVDMGTGEIWSRARNGELKKTGQKVQY